MSSVITLPRRPRPASSAEGHVARFLHPSAEPVGRPLPIEMLAVIADGLGSSLAVEDDGPLTGRRCVQLLATATYQAWAITWGPSTCLELHDHGGSLGAVRVVRGQLVETSTSLRTRALLRSHRLDAGDILTVGHDTVHEVWNPQQTPAVSVHVYSPPLTTMTFYDERPATYLTPLRTELVSGAAEHDVAHAPPAHR
jgi:cysteine dioxygenase type I